MKMMKTKRGVVAVSPSCHSGATSFSGFASRRMRVSHESTHREVGTTKVPTIRVSIMGVARP
jgi:hypothetical protein